MKKFLKEFSEIVAVFAWIATSLVGFIALFSRDYPEAAAYFSLACMNYLILINLKEE